MEIKKLQKAEERARIPEHMRRIPVKNKITGRILKGDEAPLLPELESWLEKHPDYEAIPDYDSDNDDENAEGEGEEKEKEKKEETEQDIIEKARLEAKKEEDEYNTKGVKGEANYYQMAHTMSKHHSWFMADSRSIRSRASSGWCLSTITISME